MTARWHRCSFSSLLLLSLLMLLSPASQEPPGDGGHLSPGDVEDPSSGKAKQSSVKSDSPTEGELPSVKDFFLATGGRALSSGVELSTGEEELPTYEDDPSPGEGQMPCTEDDPTEDALHLVFSSSRNQSPAPGNSSREKRSDEEQEDDTFKTNVMTANQGVAASPRRGGSVSAPRQLVPSSAIMTLRLCRSIYRSEYGKKATNYAFVYVSGRNVLIMIVMKNFVDLCLPLFRTFEKCVEVKFLTICPAAKLGFLHSHGCVRQSPQDKYFYKLLAFHLLEDDTECFEGICDGSYRFIESSIGGLTYQLFNVVAPRKRRVCFARPSFLSNGKNQTLYMVKNNERPCCYAMYFVAWLGHPEEHGLNGRWSFLPTSCRVGEVLLMLMVAGVAVSGVLGNVVVVVVMVSGSHLGQESSMLRTSLAAADLLNGLFVVVPSFFYHLAPFFRPPEYETLTGLQTLHGSRIVKRDTQGIILTNVLTYKEGFHLFQSLVYGTCSFVSLLTLLLLSAERSVMTGRSLRYKHYITKGRIKATIVSTWILGLLETLLLHYGYDGSISSAWSTFSKVPRRTSLMNPFGLAYAFFSNLYIVIYIVAGVATVVFSILAIRNFIREESRVAAEWKSYGMRTTEHYYQENRRILTTMVLMIVFYLISIVPITILFILNIAKYGFAGIYFFGYLSVWLFLASTAWNPWLYNLRSSQFISDLAELLQKVLPTPLSERFRPYITHSQQNNKWDNTELTPARKKMLSKLGLAET